MPGQTAVDPGSQKKSVELTFENFVSEQNYCSDGRIYLKFKTVYTNTGTAPLILDKESKFFYKWKIKQIAGKMKKNYQEMIAPMFDEADIYKNDQKPDENSFVTLQPGEAYSFYTKAGILIDLRSKRHQEGLKPGKYSVQFWAATWLYSLMSAGDYRRKWQDKGYLWTGDIIAVPTEFEIKAKQPLTECKIP